MRNRYRRMYELTGLPGWEGRSPSGLGPCAQYLMHGMWPTPQMNAAWSQGRVPYSPAPGFPMPGFTTPYDPWGAAELTPDQELNFLQEEARQIREELSAIEQRIQELDKTKK